MKTKFDSIVKIKKNEADKIEKNIQKVNFSINDLKIKISFFNKKLQTFSFPLKGTFNELKQIKIMQENLINEIKNFENQIKFLENRKKELLEFFKEANIEYEKMKYLQKTEIKKQLKEAGKKESLEMDEIAILLNNRKKYEQ